MAEEVVVVEIVVAHKTHLPVNVEDVNGLHVGRLSSQAKHELTSPSSQPLPERLFWGKILIFDGRESLKTVIMN